MTNLYSKRDAYFSFAVAVFCYLLVQLGLGLLLGMVAEGSFWYCFLYACLSVSIFVVAFLYSKIVNKNFALCTKSVVKPRVAHVLWGCLATVGLIHLMLPLNQLLLDFIEKCGLPRPDTSFSLPIFALVIITVLLAPVAEEFLFRGTIGQGLVSGKNPVGGIFASGALFALFHLNPAQTLHQFALGSLLMLLTYRSGSVWTSVIVHAFNNLVVIVLSYTVEPTGFYQNNMLLTGILGAVVFAGAVVGYLLTTKNYAKAHPKQVDVTSQGQNQGKTAFIYQGATLLFAVAVVMCVVLWVSSLLGA